MNKQTALTWKYFWQQKWEETRDFIQTMSLALIITGIIFILSTAEQAPLNWQGVILVILVLLCVLIPTCFLVYLFYKWIKSNWKKASARAKKEIKKNGRRKFT